MRISTKNAGVIRQAILMAHQDVSNYGTAANPTGIAGAAALYLGVSTGSMIRSGRVYEIAYTKKLDSRLAAMSDQDADKLVANANYYRMSLKERQAYDLKLEIAELENRVAALEAAS